MVEGGEDGVGGGGGDGARRKMKIWLGHKSLVLGFPNRKRAWYTLNCSPLNHGYQLTISRCPSNRRCVTSSFLDPRIAISMPNPITHLGMYIPDCVISPSHKSRINSHSQNAPQTMTPIPSPNPQPPSLYSSPSPGSIPTTHHHTHPPSPHPPSLPPSTNNQNQ